MVMDLGQKLRAIRTSKGITLHAIATETGLSKSFVSQVESSTTNPSIASLKKIAEVLDIPVAALFDDTPNGRTGNDREYGPGADGSANAAGAALALLADSPQSPRNEVAVVRSDKRKMLIWPGQESTIYLLTPDLQRKLEVTLSTLYPGYDTGDPYSHEGEEFGLVLEGAMEVTVDGKSYVLEAGDSIYYPSHLPHSSRLLGDQPGKTLWVITPPSF